MVPAPPSYDGRGLVNLVAELERRLTGASPSPGLDRDLAALLPDASTYLLVVFDGLGDAQLQRPETRALRASRAGTVDAPFPTTTTVGLASVVTGLPPRAHGVLGHLVWLPELGEVVNSLKWVTLDGRRVEYDTASLLPAPNLWERLRGAGAEPITVQPHDFAATPLTAALYRGARFEGVSTVDEAVEAATVLARSPGRLVVAYFAQVDYAAHVWGQASQGYREALGLVDRVWSEVCRRLPEGTVAVGTADHGHVDYDEPAKRIVRDRRFDALTFYGDPRAVMVRGEPGLVADFARLAGGTLVSREEALPLWGTGPSHPAFLERAPDAVVLAPPGSVIIPRGFDKRMVGYHGGLERAEVEVPLLVSPA